MIIIIVFCFSVLKNYYCSETSVKGDCPMLKTVLQSYDALSASEADVLNATRLVQMISASKLLGLTLETLRVGLFIKH